MNIPKRLLFHSASLIAGSVIGLLWAFNITRTDREIVHGFPLPWAAWQKVGDGWQDFVSPLSPVLFVVDVLSGIASVYLVLLLIGFVVRRAGSKNSLATLMPDSPSVTDRD